MKNRLVLIVFMAFIVFLVTGSLLYGQQKGWWNSKDGGRSIFNDNQGALMIGTQIWNHPFPAKLNVLGGITTYGGNGIVASNGNITVDGGSFLGASFRSVADNGNLIMQGPGGKVGIGTESPTHTLTVNGSIKANEIIVAEGGSDFVFKNDYRLMSLGELEQSIKYNKHLPGIPSEKEVLKNGVQLGEMQSKLLQKVEELTLYVIELNNKLDIQRKELNDLKEENELRKKRTSLKH